MSLRGAQRRGNLSLRWHIPQDCFTTFAMTAHMSLRGAQRRGNLSLRCITLFEHKKTRRGRRVERAWLTAAHWHQVRGVQDNQWVQEQYSYLCSAAKCCVSFFTFIDAKSALKCLMHLFGASELLLFGACEGNRSRGIIKCVVTCC